MLCLPVKAQTSDTTRHADTSLLKPAADTTKKDTIVNAGLVITGKVEDMNTSEGIPFAVVFFPKVMIGTTADMDGKFTINIDSLPKDSLRISALGYTTINKKLMSGAKEYNFVIEMERSNSLLREVTIKAVGEDPALILMRHIIEHKPDNDPDRLDNYSYESYNRLEADLQRLNRTQFSKIPILKKYTFIYDNLDTVSESNPYLPLYMTETLSDYYFTRKPKKQREFIKASMVKGVNNENVVKY